MTNTAQFATICVSFKGAFNVSNSSLAFNVYSANSELTTNFSLLFFSVKANISEVSSALTELILLDNSTCNLAIAVSGSATLLSFLTSLIFLL